MPEQTHSKKNIIIIAVIIIAVAIAGYMYAGRDQAADSSLLSSEPAGETVAVDGDLLSALHDLQQLKLDASIFSDPVWLSLSDFSQTLSPLPAGRPNPFAPIDSSVQATSTVR
jgi:hypothetical protein